MCILLLCTSNLILSTKITASASIMMNITVQPCRYVSVERAIFTRFAGSKFSKRHQQIIRNITTPKAKWEYQKYHQVSPANMLIYCKTMCFDC